MWQFRRSNCFLSPVLRFAVGSGLSAPEPESALRERLDAVPLPRDMAQALRAPGPSSSVGQIVSAIAVR